MKEAKKLGLTYQHNNEKLQKIVKISKTKQAITNCVNEIRTKIKIWQCAHEPMHSLNDIEE
jgi:hypothetical protein